VLVQVPVEEIYGKDSACLRMFIVKLTSKLLPLYVCMSVPDD